MDIKEILKKIIEILQESDNSKFKKQSARFDNLIKLPLDEIETILEEIIAPVNQDTYNEPSEITDEIIRQRPETLEQSTSSPEPSFIPPTTNTATRSNPPGTSIKGSTKSQPLIGPHRTTPPKVDPTLPPSTLPKTPFKPVDITKDDPVKIQKVLTPRFSGKTDEFNEWAVRELKNIYSGTMQEAGVPCQICRYYCRHCGALGDVMNGFSCTATCKLEYFNLSGNLSSRIFTLWSTDEFKTKAFKKISKDFFLGYMLILCHNHGITFTQSKSFNLAKVIRDQLYVKGINSNYEEEIGTVAVSIKLEDILIKIGEPVPIGIYISRDHLDYFLNTYKTMESV